MRAIASGDGGEELLPLVTTRGGTLLEIVTERLAEVLVETWPQLSRADAGLVADTLVRLAISHAALPAGAAAQDRRGRSPGCSARSVDELLA